MITNNIRKYRQLLHISQQDLADELQTTKQYVSKLEIGNTLPGIDVCYKVKRALEAITVRKSAGKQVINLRIEDLFFDNELD